TTYRRGTHTAAFVLAAHLRRGGGIESRGRGLKRPGTIGKRPGDSQDKTRGLPLGRATLAGETLACYRNLDTMRVVSSSAGVPDDQPCTSPRTLYSVIRAE